MVTLGVAAVAAVDRAAACYAAESIEPDPFWDFLYGPFGDNLDDYGLLPWDCDDYRDA